MPRNDGWGWLGLPRRPSGRLAMTVGEPLGLPRRFTPRNDGLGSAVVAALRFAPFAMTVERGNPKVHSPSLRGR